MPEARLAKTRRSLPEGYQFGDARDINAPRAIRADADGMIAEQWFAPGLRLRKQAEWNVIEGEQH